MKRSKVNDCSPSLVKKKKRGFAENNQKATKACGRSCCTPACCSKFVPSLLVCLLVCATIAGVVLALQLSPILKSTAVTISSTDQTNLSRTGGNTGTIVSSNITSLSTVAMTSMASITSATTMTPFCANWTWNATGITIAGNGSPGATLNQLNTPWNIYLDPQTNILYIADSQNHRIVKWLPNGSSGTIVAGTGTSGAQPDHLNTPKDVFVDSADNLYVADTNNQRIQFFPNGSTIGSTISTSWGLGNVFGVFLYNKSIYACDYANGAIWNNGTAVAGNQGLGSNSNQLNQPQGFTIDTLYNKSTMYIANSHQHTIVQWLPGASTGTIVAGINGVANTLNNTLNFPVAVKIDALSNLFVVDNNNHRIQLYCRYPSISSNGRTIAGTTGLSGTSPTYLTYPAGLALDSSLNLYVSDTSNHRIQKFMRLS